MRGKSQFFRRSFSLLILLLTVVSIFSAIPLTASAAQVTKTEKSYDIAVVFDNSGSMYLNQGWCRAKYAMEIFAAMLNYDKDKLHIFPMWEVTTDGSQPNSGGSYEAFEIKSKGDIDKISNLYTVRPSGTPFVPVTEAYDYLQLSGADEKWLIVLTDGKFTQETRTKSGSIDLQNRLSSLASESIKVQYLGFGDAKELQANEAGNFYAKKSSDTSLKDDLVEICNSIFQRSVLPSNRLSGDKLNLDLSMKNVIVFAQGANAKITSLKDSSGKKISVTLDSGQRKYSEVKAKGYANAPVDTSLAGQVVTFAACPKGEYTLSYTDADKIEIFYEPDVDIDVSFVNSDGQKIENAKDFVAGEYTVTSRIVDAKTGEDVTNHELMGKDVQLNTYVKTSKDSKFKEYNNGDKINFEPDDNTEVYIEGKYLNKYKISSKNDPKLAWLKGFKVDVQASEFKIESEVLQKDNWYCLKKHEDWQPIRVSMTLEGQPLTDEQLLRVTLDLEPSKNLKYRYEPVLGKSAYVIYIAQDENGKYIEPDTGKYKLKISAVYTDEYGKKSSAEDEVSFEIQKYGRIWRILLWILVIFVLLALWLIFMLQKVLPKSIVKDSASFTTMSSGELDSSFVDVEYRRKSKSLSISGAPSVDYNEQCSASFEIKAVDNRFTSSKRRRIAIIDIDSPCDEVKVGGTKYINYEGRWIKATDQRKAENGREIPTIEQIVSSGSRYEISRSGGLSTLTCKTKTVK